MKRDAPRNDRGDGPPKPHASPGSVKFTYWHFRLILYTTALVVFVVGAITGLGHPRSWGVIFFILVAAIIVLVVTRPRGGGIR